MKDLADNEEVEETHFEPLTNMDYYKRVDSLEEAEAAEGILVADILDKHYFRMDFLDLNKAFDWDEELTHKVHTFLEGASFLLSSLLKILLEGVLHCPLYNIYGSFWSERGG